MANNLTLDQLYDMFGFTAEGRAENDARILDQQRNDYTTLTTGTRYELNGLLGDLQATFVRNGRPVADDELLGYSMLDYFGDDGAYRGDDVDGIGLGVPHDAATLAEYETRDA